MRLGRLTLGLYNSYDPKRLREAHRRALARVGPLALAFDANIATFGFPFPDDLRTPVEVAEWLSTTTSIGKDGGYMLDVANAGRFHTFPYPGRGFPPQLGDVVLTTSRPEDGRSVTIDDVVARLRSGRSVTVLFGLGPHGVPSKVHRMCAEHMDVTGRGLSMETCTAMGAVAAVIGTSIRQ